MAAGLGTRLRPLTEHWPKPVLPIDGRPVIATLLRELAAAGCERVWVVTGHLAEQVETLVGDGAAFGVAARFVRQPDVLGSADAVQRALEAGAEAPAVVSAADTLFGRGDVGRFAGSFGGADVAGHATGMLTIGRRNVLAARSVLWQNGIMVHGEDVGGGAPRTVTIAVASGQVTVKSDGRVVTEL